MIKHKPANIFWWVAEVPATPSRTITTSWRFQRMQMRRSQRRSGQGEIRLQCWARPFRISNIGEYAIPWYTPIVGHLCNLTREDTNFFGCKFAFLFSRHRSMCLLRQAYRKLALKLHPDKNGAPGADEVGSRRGDPPLKRCDDDWACPKMIRIPSGKLTVCYGSHCPFSSLIYPKKMVIFHSYVRLPKDKDTPKKTFVLMWTLMMFSVGFGENSARFMWANDNLDAFGSIWQGCHGDLPKKSLNKIVANTMGRWTFRHLFLVCERRSFQIPRCSMVLVYAPTFARTKSPSFVGKYTIQGAYGI